MREHKLQKLLVVLISLPILCISASANSSWVWISEQRPFDLLPVVVVATLIIEILVIDKLGGVNRLLHSGWIIVLANLLSFLTPYLLSYMEASPVGYTFSQCLNHSPSFIVGIGYLLLTLIVEVPVVYNGLKKDVLKRRQLITVVCIVNAITTILIALVERTLCHGQWLTP